MDFDLSEDQRALQDEARRFLDEQCPTARVRAAMAADEGYDRDLWMAMVDQGWPATAVPEGLGGLGLGTVELAVLLEQTGAHVAPTPFLQEALALDALSRAAAAGAAEAGWLDPVLQGDSVAAIAWQPVRAERDGARWLLSGRSGPALYAPEADVVVVPGVDPDGGEHLFVVNARARHVTAEPAMDQTRSLGWVELEGTPSLHLGDAEAATAFADLGAVAHAAELLGAADRVLGMTVDYAKERVQFGRPIGSFQAVKHRCADMLVDVEGMRSVVYYAAWCLSADDPDRSDRRRRDGQDHAVLRRRSSGHGLGPPGARRHRVHLGARPAPVLEAGPARRGQLRRRHAPPDPPGRPCCGGSSAGTASFERRVTSR
ncbi:MAG: acyl-CoA/acyl-ACP dehydrogenase [Microthrixaceae bacterium]|nr:acyl-CoA/acyl-ACP dehydrogenase [Microthrixaceae bacterium]